MDTTLAVVGVTVPSSVEREDCVAVTPSGFASFEESTQ